ncbi:hypothetical protein OC835_007911 [Tilletia horrida]|nr:hypothetical protein OC835_007911 [Tilletia horrida]
MCSSDIAYPADDDDGDEERDADHRLPAHVDDGEEGDDDDIRLDDFPVKAPQYDRPMPKPVLKRPSRGDHTRSVLPQAQPVFQPKSVIQREEDHRARRSARPHLEPQHQHQHQHQPVFPSKPVIQPEGDHRARRSAPLLQSSRRQPLQLKGKLCAKHQALHLLRSHPTRARQALARLSPSVAAHG